MLIENGGEISAEPATRGGLLQTLLFGFSEATARAIDDEVRRIVGESATTRPSGSSPNTARP